MMTNTECIKRYGVTRAKMAELCGVHPQTVDKWFMEDGEIPAKYCPLLRLKIGLPLNILNPTVFNDDWVAFEENKKINKTYDINQ